MSEIVDVYARELLDSLGEPAVEVEVVLADGSSGRSVVSTPEVAVHVGLIAGTVSAADFVNRQCAEAVKGMEASDQRGVDHELERRMGTLDRGLGLIAATRAVSLAIARAAAQSCRMELFTYLGGAFAQTLPIPVVSVVDSSACEFDPAFRELGLVFLGPTSYGEALRWGVEVHRAMRDLLARHDVNAAFSPKGTFSLNLASCAEGLDCLDAACRQAGLRPGVDVLYVVDAGAQRFYDADMQLYEIEGGSLTRSQLVGLWEDLVVQCPIGFIKDGVAEADAGVLREFAQAMGERVRVLNTDIPANRVLVDIVSLCLEDVPTLSAFFENVECARRRGMLVSVRLGEHETEDSFAADLAVAAGASLVEFGAPVGGERIAKYNELLRIEDELLPGGGYAGSDAFGLARSC